MDKKPDKNSKRQLLWHQTLVQHSEDIAFQLNQLSQARYTTLNLLLTGQNNPIAEIMAGVVRDSAFLLDTFAPGDFQHHALHELVYTHTDHVAALCNPDCESEWRKRGYTYSLRETLRALLFLYTIYEHLLYMARRDAEILMSRECLWVLQIFRLVSTAPQ